MLICPVKRVGLGFVKNLGDLFSQLYIEREIAQKKSDNSVLKITPISDQYLGCNPDGYAVACVAGKYWSEIGVIFRTELSLFFWAISLSIYS